MNDIAWRKVVDRSLPNLHVLSMRGVDYGFVYKPKDSRTDKNMWRCHRGIGEHNEFLGHQWTKDSAFKTVESVFGLHQTR